MEQFKVAKWGNSLAVRLPRKLVTELGLKEGDLLPGDVISRGAVIRARLLAEREASKLTREEALKLMRQSRCALPEDWKIDRNDPDARG